MQPFLASFYNKHKNKARAINVVRGMKTKCEMGIRPCMTPLGYLNDPIHAKGMKVITLDPEKAPIIKKFFEMSANGISGRDILDWADKKGFRSRYGKKLSLTVLYDTLNNPYYYGKFEWPEKSGNWYDVNHESIITKDIFDKVQARFKSMPKGRTGNKQFDFTGVMKCGECGSSITAEEKWKTLKNGTKRKYIYYLCTKYTKRNCKQPTIREDVLLPQLIKMMDGVNIDKFLLRKEYDYEIDKFRHYSNELSEKYRKEAKQQIDIRSHMKYVLRNGEREDKKRLLKNLGGKIYLQDKYIFLK